jgi:hypothetical protein
MKVRIAICFLLLLFEDCLVQVCAEFEEEFCGINNVLTPIDSLFSVQSCLRRMIMDGIFDQSLWNPQASNLEARFASA